MEISEIITGNSFLRLCDEYLSDNKKEFSLSKEHKTIFLPTDWLGQFRKRVLPYLNYKFILVTHNGDREAPGNHYDLLSDGRIIHWYGMNCTHKHDKFTPLPIGIANEEWPHGNKEVLVKVVNENHEKYRLVYANFDINTNYSERVKAWNWSQSQGYINRQSNKLQFEEYLRVLSTHKYVIAPPGNGVDCHRIWEAIYLGVIPIVKNNIAYWNFQDLPILYVDRYEDLTEDFLLEQYNNIITKPKEKAFLSYYKTLISNDT